MGMTNAGGTFVAQAILGESVTVFNAANAYLGVGDSNTAFAVAQTDLQAASNKARQGMDSSYPTRSTRTITWRATFGTSSANYAWQEWGVFNASSSGTMLARVVESLGTKTSAQSWQLEVQLTLVPS
jgi:hypothetical protein